MQVPKCFGFGIEHRAKENVRNAAFLECHSIRARQYETKAKKLGAVELCQKRKTKKVREEFSMFWFVCSTNDRHWTRVFWAILDQSFSCTHLAVVSIGTLTRQRYLISRQDEVVILKTNFSKHSLYAFLSLWVLSFCTATYSNEFLLNIALQSTLEL